MGLLQWDAGLATGHQDFDDQHRGLVAAYNSLASAVTAGAGRETLETALVQLRQRTVAHFAWEEKLMTSAGYPAAEEHLATHHDLVAQLSELVTRFRADQAALTPPVMDFLEGWLVYHLKGDDVRLAAALTAPRPAGSADQPR